MTSISSAARCNLWPVIDLLNAMSHLIIHLKYLAHSSNGQRCSGHAVYDVCVAVWHAHVFTCYRVSVRSCAGPEENSIEGQTAHLQHVKSDWDAEKLTTHHVLRCSGMLPGYVAGFYDYDACHVDLLKLATFAQARLHQC